VQDTELVARCADGESRAWDELVTRHAALLHAVVARIVDAADAEDVVQAVFVKLWEDGRRRLRTFEGRSRLSTWLVVLARREALDHARARDARRRLVGAVAVEASLNGKAHPDPADDFASNDERARLLAKVDGLPPRDRLLVRLVYLDGCAYADVARLLAVPENSISPWLSRARDRLRSSLADGRAPDAGPPAVYGSGARAPLKGRSETP